MKYLTPWTLCFLRPAPYPGLQVVERLRDYDIKHSMGAAALFIHVGCSDRPRLISLRHQRFDILESEHKEHSLSSTPGMHTPQDLREPSV